MFALHCKLVRDVLATQSSLLHQPRFSLHPHYNASMSTTHSQVIDAINVRISNRIFSPDLIEEGIFTSAHATYGRDERYFLGFA